MLRRTRRARRTRRTRIRPARQQDRSGKDEELVYERQRIGDEHIQHEEGATDRHDRPRADLRENRSKHASDHKAHAL